MPTLSTRHATMQDTAHAKKDRKYLDPRCNSEEQSKRQRVESEISTCPTESSKAFQLLGSASAAYFSRDVNGHGIDYIISKAIYESDDHEVAAQLSPKQKMVYFQISQIANLLPSTQWSIFANVLNEIHAIGKQEGSAQATTMKSKLSENSSSPSKVPVQNDLVFKIPRSFNEIRRQYFRGPSSFRNLIPHPPIRTIDDHSYVSLIACIGDLIACGHSRQELIKVDSEKLMKQDGVKQVHESIQAQIMFHDMNSTCSTSIKMMGQKFSDGFDPFSIKNNRQNAWVLSTTIVPQIHQRNLKQFTYLISMGPHDSDHEVVLRKYKEELESLRKGEHCFYNPKEKKLMRVQFDIISILEDTPEYSAMNGIGAHNGKFTTRRGYRMNVKEVFSRLKSCSNCIASMNKRQAIQNCKECVNWDFDSESHLIAYSPPKDYPSDTADESNMLHGGKILFSDLSTAVDECHAKVAKGMWTPAAGKAYLRAKGTSVEEAQKRTKVAYKWFRYNKSIENRVEDPNQYEEMQQYIQTSPQDFIIPPKPTSWSLGPNHAHHISVIMHTLIDGGCDAAFDLIVMWAKKRTIFTQFTVATAGVLERVQNFRLDWIKPQAYKNGTLGGYVSENKRALALLSKWFYSVLLHMTEDIPYSEPILPIHQWKRSQLEGWLKARRIKPIGKKEELKAEVISLKKQSGGPPPIVGPSGGPIILVEQMIGCMLSMVSHTLSRTVNHQLIEETRRSIKLFLSSVEILHTCIREDREKQKDSIVTMRGTLMSLLNIPENMKEIGPTYLHYEGSNRGEGIIKEIKPHIRTMAGNWAFNATTEFYKQRSMEYLESILMSETKCNISSEQSRKRNYYTYKSTQHAHDAYNTGQPLSVMVSTKQEFMMMISNNKALSLKPNGGKQKKFGCYYHEWICEAEPEYIEANEEIEHHTLFLPLLNETGMIPDCQKHMYYTITSEWKELSDDLEFVLPQCPTVVIESLSK